ncbi:MAG: acyl-CoA thioesterase [Ramlibacter sp.]
MASPKEILVTHPLRVRYGETDQMGVVYHANYFVWFDDARDALLREAGIRLDALESAGYRFPVVEASCRYLRSARYGEEVLVRAHLQPEKVARMRFRFEVHGAAGLRLLATGTSLSVLTDAHGKLLLRAPPAMDQALAALLAKQRGPTETELQP